MNKLRNIPFLPHFLRVVAEGTGHIADAYKFSAEYGGQKLYIPTKVDEKSEIYRRLGREILEVLIGYCDNHQGDNRQIQVPLFGGGSFERLRRGRRMIVANNPDANVNDLVKITGASRCTIQRDKKRMNEQKDVDLLTLMNDS